ncbi:hypothetical protein SNK03_13617 [Fusarium graminearum]|nr:unnamed protein product [Fusarium graminearum]
MRCEYAVLVLMLLLLLILLLVLPDQTLGLCFGADHTLDAKVSGTLTVRQRKVTTKKEKALEINENANLVHAIPCSEQQPATFDSNHDLMLEMPKATDLSVLTNKTSSSTWDTSFF